MQQFISRGILIIALGLHACAPAESGVAKPSSGVPSTPTPATPAVLAAKPDSASQPEEPHVLQSAPAVRRDTVPTPPRSEWRPKMPMIMAGSCPGEDCTYGGLAVACTDMSLVASDSVGAKPIGLTVHKGDTVTLVTGNFHLLEPGIVVMKRDYTITDYEDGDYKASRPDTLRFFAGDTVYVLNYEELGVWDWWYRGNPGSGDEFWTGAFQRSFEPGDDQRPAAAMSRPHGEWWYKLQVDAAHEGGWIHNPKGRWADPKFVSFNSDWSCESHSSEPEP